jgi:hypothetical protein
MRALRGSRRPQIIKIANSVEAVRDGRIYIELINGPMLFEHKATPAEYGAGRDYAVANGIGPARRFQRSMCSCAATSLPSETFQLRLKPDGQIRRGKGKKQG